MIVMKFGGTSIATTEAVQRVMGIIQRFLPQKPIVVNSAMGKTTRNLLSIAHLSETGQTEQAKEKLQEIIDYHDTLASSVLNDYEYTNAHTILHAYFSELEKLLHGMSVLQDLTDRSLDKFLSYGERMSTAIMAEALNQNGMAAILMDARQFIITDDHFGQAKPLIDETYAKIAIVILPVLKKNQIPVVQGYIGATRQGITTTLGFEGSDLSATLLGAALQADDIQIWKDVPGIMTADPHLIPDTHTVRKISFEEAGELTFFGAKVLHPSSLTPAREKNVPVHVYNSTSPDDLGTEITQTAGPCQNLIKSIAYKRDLCLIKIQGSQSQTAYDFMKSVFDILNRSRVAPYLMTSAETQITLVVGNSIPLNRLTDDLKALGQVQVFPQKATITLVGETAKHAPRFPQQIMTCLNEVSVELIGYGASAINFTLVVDENRIQETVHVLHTCFFDVIDPSIFS